MQQDFFDTRLQQDFDGDGIDGLAEGPFEGVETCVIVV